jgi:hypothetical protein
MDCCLERQLSFSGLIKSKQFFFPCFWELSFEKLFEQFLVLKDDFGSLLPTSFEGTITYY